MCEVRDSGTAADEIEIVKPEQKFLFDEARPKLSPRELEIVNLLATGEKRDAVADQLKISRHTLDQHLRRVFTKLGIHTITAVVFFMSRDHVRRDYV